MNAGLELRNIGMTQQRRSQGGAALIVVIMLLVVVTLLGLAAMRSTLLQERMTGNLSARGEAFQSAEGALRVAEEAAANYTGVLPAANTCSGTGWCGRHDPNGQNEAAWQQAGFWERANDGPADASVSGIRGKAKYVVEDYGHGLNEECLITDLDMSAPECQNQSQIYRITSRAELGNGAVVTLQSLYEVP